MTEAAPALAEGTHTSRPTRRGEPTPPRDDSLGVALTDLSLRAAVRLLEGLAAVGDGRTRAVFFVHAHTMNLAWKSPSFRARLNAADVVFCDSAGPFIAVRLCGGRVRVVAGNDLVPLFLRRAGRRRCRCFLLGARPGVSARAAERLERAAPGIRVVGHAHGYLGSIEAEQLPERIRAAAPDVLLVGLGNPCQEEWILDNAPRLGTPLVLGVGGLFDYWGGGLRRAPRWMRLAGLEWLYIVMQQPHKWRRYAVGHPQFVWRAVGRAVEPAPPDRRRSSTLARPRT